MTLPRLDNLLTLFDRNTGEIPGAPMVRRYLADLRGCFADAAAFEAELAKGNPLVYSVTAVEPGTGEGDLHYGIGRLMPGRVGKEYWMTKGHLHAWRPAAEFYIGLHGKGAMLLEPEEGTDARLVPLEPDSAVYVPGHVAHRTVNIGDEPLVYLGIYPARAGHDYAVIAKRNFRHVVMERDGTAACLPR